MQTTYRYASRTSASLGEGVLVYCTSFWIIVQLCQFHQVLTVKAKLTSRPKLEASRDLLRLTLMLCHTDKESFVGALEAWHAKWEDFIGERTASPDGKSHYTHKAVHSAYMSLKRNMP